MKILFVHLLNNYSGSPKVLSTELKLLTKNTDYEISLLTSNTEGFLSNIENLKYYYNGYRWTYNKILLAFLFGISQLKSFLFVLFHKFDIVYINTVVPFGAALAAKIRHETVIYHVHEVYLNPGFVKRLYINVMEKCSKKIICVSKYVQNNISILNKPNSVIYNPIEIHEINDDITEFIKNKYNKKIVFMPTSLKTYKGITQFINIAINNKDLRFILLCNVPIEEMKQYFKDYDLPDNLKLIGKQNNLIEYYNEAAVVMNLTLPDQCIETFGLTLVEGFDAFTPAVAPGFGGPKEIIVDGINGFLVNPYDIDYITEKLRQIFLNFDNYKRYSINARKSLDRFNNDIFIKKIIKEINEAIP